MTHLHGAFGHADSARLAGRAGIQTIFVVDDDELTRETIRGLLSAKHLLVRLFSDAPAFLEHTDIALGDCLITDIRMPHMSGFELQKELRLRGIAMPVIVLTGYGDVPQAVEAMKGGAFDFIQKPFKASALKASVDRALERARRQRLRHVRAQAAQGLVECLTGREREVFELLVKGEANKIIAHMLDISPRTVEAHRAKIQEKLRASCLADLVRIASAAGGGVLATN